jgi:hypothetical protein
MTPSSRKSWKILILTFKIRTVQAGDAFEDIALEPGFQTIKF